MPPCNGLAQVDCLLFMRSNMSSYRLVKLIFELNYDANFRAEAVRRAGGHAAARRARTAPPGARHLGGAAHAPAEPRRPGAADWHFPEHRPADGGWLCRHCAAYVPAGLARAGPAR